MKNILDIKNLNLFFKKENKEYQGLFNINMSLKDGETVGIIGESGSGKTQFALSILGLSSENSRRTGEIIFDEKNLLNSNENELNKIRGNRISISLQSTSLSLNPYMKVGDQLIEPLVMHYGENEEKAEKKAIKMLDDLKIPDSKKAIKKYPYEFSGGQQQRFLIAMSLICEPSIFIADEITTSLDMVTQKIVLNYLKEMQKKTNMSILFISHNLKMLKNFADRIVVMYCGHVVEEANVSDFFSNPKHYYSKGLVELIPNIKNKSKMLKTIPGEISQLNELNKGCPFASRCFHAADICYSKKPQLENIGNRKVACFCVEK